MSNVQKKQPNPGQEVMDLPGGFNPPGLSGLSYQAATYQTSLARMLARLPAETVKLADDSIQTPLSHLNVEAQDDWAVAVLHAWALVADVLSFYQERIVNEGYLRTATERRSLLELARSIGYELRPGVAASTYLAFTVQVGQDEPPRQVDVPANTAVQGMPAVGQPPQVFETSGALTARSEWNLLRPVGFGATCSEHDIHPETTSLRLLGNRADLQPGDPVLILGENKKPWRPVRLVAVEPDLERGFTVVRWENDPAAAPDDAPLRRPRLFVMGQQASLFGYTPTGVYRRAKEDIRWRPAGIGLPDTAVNMLVAGQPGQLFAATEKDIFRSVDQGATWTRASTGLIEKNITALTIADNGQLWAGSDEGEVFRSGDNGDNWRAPAGDRILLPAKGLKKLWPAVVSGPLPKTVIRSLAGYGNEKKPTLAAGTDDGVFLSSNGGKSWKPANISLPGVDQKTGLTKEAAWTVMSARIGKKKALFAGTDAGVFRISRPLNLWTIIVLGLLLILLEHLYVKILFKAHKVSLADPLQTAKFLLTQVTTWLGSLPIPLVDQLVDKIQELVKTLPEKLPRIEDLFGISNGQFQGVIDFLNGVLLITLDVALIVALLVVVYLAWWWVRRYINSRSYRCIGLAVYALAASPTGQLFAGTEHGLYRSNDPAAWRQQRGLRRLVGRLVQSLFPGWNRSWELVKPEVDVRALTRAVDGTLVAGTATGELWHSEDNGRRWDRDDPGPQVEDVRAVVDTQAAVFAAGVPVDAEVDPQWSSCQLRDRAIHLDAIYSDLTPGTWMVLKSQDQADQDEEGQPQHKKAQMRLYGVERVDTVESRDFARAGKLTSLQVDTHIGLDTFDRGTTAVLLQSEALDLYADRPVWGTEITLNHFVPGLEPGHLMIVSGQPMRARLVGQPAGQPRLTGADGLRQAQLQPGESCQVLAPPGPATGGDETRGVGLWYLRNREGFEGTIPAGAATFVLEPALEEDQVVAETAVVKMVKSDPDHTTIQLEQPLRYVFDRPSVAIYGNVVHATHGQTVRDEVVGSSDGSQSFQRFWLRQWPLTFVSTPTASGLETTLVAHVNQVTWDRVDFLYGLDRGRRAYIVRQDARGNTSLIFGDGQQGARLPSGHEQITATYRIGIGPQGNMPAGSLKQLQTVPPGIEGVVNPLPATGGVGPEELTQARQLVPLTVRKMNRIVSLADFEDFARLFAGVGKAQARLLHVGRRELLHITIADGQGQPVPGTPGLYRNLVQAIDQNRSAPQPEVRVDSYQPVYFNVRARLLIDPHHWERRAVIEADIRLKISQAFAFGQREFGQDVTDSELISLMQDTPGVLAVELVHLHRSAETAGLAQVLEANLARWHDGRLLPAQMLMVNSQTGITLNVEGAT
jgi:hypothetical protein